MTKMTYEVAIEHIRIVLQKPATAWQEVADRVSERVGREIPVGRIWHAVGYLRKHHEEFGWNVMHIGAGGISPTGRDEGRIFRVGVNAEAMSEEERDHMKRGSLSLLRELHSKGVNQASMLAIAAGKFRSPTIKRKLLEQSVIVQACNLHIASVLEQVAQEVKASSKAA